MLIVFAMDCFSYTQIWRGDFSIKTVLFDKRKGVDDYLYKLINLCGQFVTLTAVW